MTEFTTKNRVPLNIIIVILWLLITAIDNQIEKDTSTPIQWVAFILMFFALIYVNFISVVDEVELEEEHYVPSLQDKQVEELEKSDIEWNDLVEVLYNKDSLSDEQSKEYLSKYGHLDATGSPIPKEALDGKQKMKTVFIMQPINITQEEFDNKINPQIDMEKETKTELPKALTNPDVVTGYSLHNINKKHRGMYADICGFAIGVEPKKESEILAKVTSYGQKFTTERSGKTTIAFNIETEPKIRIPEKGYFEVK